MSMGYQHKWHSLKSFVAVDEKKAAPIRRSGSGSMLFGLI